MYRASSFAIGIIAPSMMMTKTMGCKSSSAFAAAVGSHMTVATAGILQSKRYNSTSEPPEVPQMRQIIENLTKDPIKAPDGRPSPNKTDKTVVLTGTVGTLAPYLVDELIHDKTVKSIILLNRHGIEETRTKQINGAIEKGLSEDFSKITFALYDPLKPFLGLAPEVLKHIQDEADFIVHTAWIVNFNIPLLKFEPIIGSVRYIADIAATSRKRIGVTFTSSIASGGNWDMSTGKCPEAQITDLTVPSNNYGRSKATSSLILDKLSEPGDFPHTIIRLGQLAGPTLPKGCWRQREWFPRMARSALFLKALPSEIGGRSTISWSPVNWAAKLMLEMSAIAGDSKHTPDEMSGYFNLVNPHTTQWSDAVLGMQRALGKDRVPELIPFQEWIARLEAPESMNAPVKQNAATPLLSTWKAWANLKAPLAFSMERMAHDHITDEFPPINSKVLKHLTEALRY